MSCNVAIIGGWGACSKKLEKMKGLALQAKGHTWTEANLLSLAAWRLAIAGLADENSNHTVLPVPITGFEPTTDDQEIVTSTLGKKEKGMNSIPSGIAYLDASLIDYKDVVKLDGLTFEAFPYFDGNSMWATLKADGTYKGMTVTIGTKIGFAPDDKTKSFPIYLFFDSYEEFEDVAVYMPVFKFKDILDFTPAGLILKPTSAYSGTDISVAVYKRGTGEPMTGLDAAANFPSKAVSYGTDLPAVVTAVDDSAGNGAYTLTVQKGATPAALVDSDAVTIQAQEDDETYITYLSNPMVVIGA